jgi:hypothetical protein
MTGEMTGEIKGEMKLGNPLCTKGFRRVDVRDGTISAKAGATDKPCGEMVYGY